MQAVYTSIFLAILCTSGVVGLKSPNPKDQNSKTKPSFFEGTQCGISKGVPKSARIIGGVEATPHSWPWMVLIQCTFVQGQNTYTRNCGGTIISESWVVTASHCLDPTLIDNIQRDCMLAFGKHDIQQMEPTQVMGNIIKRYFIHPQYNKTAPGYNHDIALLKLANNLQFNGAIQPLCLPWGLQELPDNKTCYATGWGVTYLGSPEHPKRLNQLSMKVADEHYCNRFGRIICAVTWDNNKGPCDGDSGGPLACQEHGGNWYLRGVLSRAASNCKFWAVFTKVAGYENWIKVTMNLTSNQ